MQSFLGHAGFYNRFIKDFSKISRPLCNLLAKDVIFNFDRIFLYAFNIFKEVINIVSYFYNIQLVFSL